MKNYKTLKPMTFQRGTIRLNSDQAEKRKLCLKPGKGRDVYEIISPVQFVAGEVVGLDAISLEQGLSMEEVKRGAE